MNKILTEHLTWCLAPCKYSVNHSQVVTELRRDLDGKGQHEQNRQKKGRQ